MEDLIKVENNKAIINLLLKTDIKYSVMRNCVNELIRQNKKILKNIYKLDNENNNSLH